MMNQIASQRVRPGDAPVGCRPGMVEISVRSRSGRALKLDAEGSAANTLRCLGEARWGLELVAETSGRLRVSDPHNDVFPAGTVLTITLDLPGGRRLIVHPAHDVSSLQGANLLFWKPGKGGSGDPELLVSIAHVEVDHGGQTDADVTPTVDIEALGDAATEARNLARQIVGGPRLPIEERRSLCLVVDRSTSMRPQLTGTALQDAVAVVTGTAAVSGDGNPSVYLAGGLRADQVSWPDGPVAAWVGQTLRADAFGFSVEALRPALPAPMSSRDVIVLTDDVPADLAELTRRVSDDPGAGRWRILVLAPDCVEPRRGPGPSCDDTVAVLAMPRRPAEGHPLRPDDLRPLVAALVAGARRTGDGKET